jgi:hypothetical protein
MNASRRSHACRLLSPLRKSAVSRELEESIGVRLPSQEAGRCPFGLHQCPSVVDQILLDAHLIAIRAEHSLLIELGPKLRGVGGCRKLRNRDGKRADFRIFWPRRSRLPEIRSRDGRRADGRSVVSQPLALGRLLGGDQGLTLACRCRAARRRYLLRLKRFPHPLDQKHHV